MSGIFDDEQLEERPRRSAVGFLSTMSTLFGMTGALGIIPALLSFLIVGAPGAINQPATAALYLSVLSYPFICFASISSAWAAHRNENDMLARGLICLPCINFIVGWLAYFYIQTYMGGKFTG